MPDQTTRYTGRCLCGTVTFEWHGPPNWVGHCHCQSCRLNTAAAFATFVGMPDGAWRWTGVSPATYVSSPGVERRFCVTCGTPVSYRAERFADEIHFYLAAHDHPGDLRPTVHYHSADHVTWLPLPQDGLERK